jgi:cell division protein FtsW
MDQEEEKFHRYNLLKINIDYYFIFIITLILSIIGIVMIYSASTAVGERYFNDAYWFIRRHAVWWFISFAAFIIFSRINYKFYKKIAVIAVLFAIGLLALVLIPALSEEIGGSRRWLNLFFFSIQPSEITKPVLMIFICAALDKRYKDNRIFKNVFWPSFAILMIVTLLIFLEPDFGTVVVIWITVFIIFFIGDVRIPHMAGLGSAGILVLVAYMFMEEYRRERIFAFLNRSGESSGVNFQVNQSLIALGSGNIIGLGLGNSVQKYSYLPEAHSDFIFAILGEEFGLAGTIVVIFFFVLIGFFGVRVCLKTEDYFGRTLAGAITGMIVMQAAINIAVVIGIIPVTGLPLPFISSGGSSLLTSMVSMGILLNIARQNYTLIKKSDGEV